MKAKVLKKQGEILIIRTRLQINEGEEIEIKKARAKRNLDQNALYWLYNQFIADQTNQTAEEVHEGFREQFLSKNTIVNNKPFRTVESTTYLDTAQFAEYFNKCDALMSVEFKIDTSEFWQQYEKIIIK